MGTFCYELVWAVGYPEVKPNECKEIDKFIRKHKDLFVRKKGIANGYVNYIMIWDGSKEGWGTSNYADILRSKFIGLCQAAHLESYHIKDHELEEKPRLAILTVGDKSK